MTAPVDQRPSTDSAAVYALDVATAARAAQLAVRAALLRDAARLWPLLKKDQLQQTFPGWLRAMQLLIANYHRQSAQAAGAAYRAARAQALRSPSPASLIRLAPPPDPLWMSKALGFAGPGMLSKDTARPGTALSTTLGTASRIVLDGGRTTIEQTTKADPAAVGWFLHTDGDPCWWCAMIASRGTVFKEHSLSQSNARFTGPGTAKTHNHCGCVLSPVFSSRQHLPEVNDAADHLWSASTGGLSGQQARDAFRKAWANRSAG